MGRFGLTRNRRASSAIRRRPDSRGPDGTGAQFDYRNRAEWHQKTMRRLPRCCCLIGVIALAICAFVSTAHAQVYKCTDAKGHTSYSDAPCGSGSKVLRVPNDAARSVTGPTVCGQLLDETRRLATEADRAAKRGRPESTGIAKRRLALTKQYERRCVAITHSDSKSR